MKTRLLIGLLFALSVSGLAQSGASMDQSLSGEWQLTTTAFSVPSTERLLLAASGKQITGTLYRDGEKISVNGTVDDHSIRLEFKIGNQQNVYVGTVSAGTWSGTYTTVGKDGKLAGDWMARRAAEDKPPSPRTLDFIPAEFHRTLSADARPVLRIWAGDTVRTKSVDAGGQDDKSVYRVMGGNPLTGPFYVEGAMPGDVLAITIKRLRINRDWAMSDSGLVGRALTVDYASENKQKWDNTRWHLDAEKQVATLENAPDKLKGFSVPMRPMLGCVGVAPGPGNAPVSTQDSGDLGGNMDFSGVREGSTLFLQVNQPGALLYLGDAHALQGDGELNGNALETSMDVEFTVDVQRGKSIGTPRVENDDYLMAIGFSGSLDNAFRIATSELASWLQADYKLSASEAAVVLGTSIEYNISEVADRNVGVVAKIRKGTLRALSHAD
jgi:acetamidase/formamidase